jgi:hypothetical protein
VSNVFLGLIALAVLVMAAAQVAAIVVLVRLSKRVDVLSARVETELGPLAEKLRAVAESLHLASGLAAAQLQRVDHLLAGVSQRTEETLGVVQHAIVGPIREIMGVVAAIRGVVGAFKAVRRGAGGTSSSRFDDEDPLFIG